MMEKDPNDKIFKAIADPTRRAILELLTNSKYAFSFTQISNHFNISRQGITKHIRVLKAAQLIEIKQVGRERYCSPNGLPLNEIKKWIKPFKNVEGIKPPAVQEVVPSPAKKTTSKKKNKSSKKEDKQPSLSSLADFLSQQSS